MMPKYKTGGSPSHHWCGRAAGRRHLSSGVLRRAAQLHVRPHSIGLAACLFLIFAVVSARAEGLVTL